MNPLHVFLKDFAKTKTHLSILHLLNLGTAICKEPLSVAASKNTQLTHLLVQSRQQNH